MMRSESRCILLGNTRSIICYRSSGKLSESTALRKYFLEYRIAVILFVQVYGAFGMTTLREMILTRPRQRSELLCVLLDFSYYERPDLKTQSLETAKELFQLDWIRPDVKVRHIFVQ